MTQPRRYATRAAVIALCIEFDAMTAAGFCADPNEPQPPLPPPEPSEIDRLVAAWPALQTWAGAVLGDRRYPES